MALTWADQINLEKNYNLIAQDPNLTPETDLEGFQNQGGYAPEPESRTPGPLTPRQQGSNVKKGDAAQRRNEESRGGDQLKPEQIWPNYPRMNIKPQDLLKILQFIPALTGGLQMANSQDLRNYLKPHTKGINVWDTGGGSLRHLSPDKILDLTRGGLDRFKV